MPTVQDEVKSKIIDTGVIVPADLRDKISKLSFKDVKTYIVDGNGVLSVVVDENVSINTTQLQSAVNSFNPSKSEAEVIKEKKDNEITLTDIIRVLRHNKLI